MPIQSLNPATGEVVREFAEFTPEQVEAALAEAAGAFRPWRDVGFEKRAEVMRRAARYLREQKERFANCITLEMGKPISESAAEIEKCAWGCEFYAEHAATFLADEPIRTNARESYVGYRPLGVVLAIMPWNFPFWQALRFAAPALMAGNTAVLKHASNVPQCALAIEEVFHEAGAPAGAFRTLLVASSAVEGLIADERIAAITLTGSADTGSRVAAAAGKALKKTVLELGGSDPFIVLADADLEGAVEFAVKARYQNTGQSCIAAKRFLIVDAVAEAFERRMVAAVEALPVGDPMRPQTKVGPLARGDLIDDLERQVRDSVAQGARVAAGGHRLEGPGFFYAPTVLLDVTAAMPAFREEVFGPVAAVTRVPDAAAAVAAANDSAYGLGGNLWTQDIAEGKRLAAGIESGQVFINGMTASDPRLPFGGVKHSGYGRELSSLGIREFTNIQTVWVGPAEGPAQASPPAE